MQAPQHGRAQLVETGEGQFHLRLHSCSPRHATSRGALDQVLQQGRLAHARLAADRQRSALPRSNRLEQSLERLTLGLPASQHQTPLHLRMSPRPLWCAREHQVEDDTEELSPRSAHQQHPGHYRPKRRIHDISRGAAAIHSPVDRPLGRSTATPLRSSHIRSLRDRGNNTPCQLSTGPCGRPTGRGRRTSPGYFRLPAGSIRYCTLGSAFMIITRHSSIEVSTCSSPSGTK